MADHAASPRGDGAAEALLEAPAQEEMDATPPPAPGCRAQAREALEGLATILVCTLMGLVLIPLGLPAFLLVGTMDLLGNVYEGCGGNRRDWTLFVVGADKPDNVSEQCNRDMAGMTEAVRGQGLWPNFLYRFRNNHPVFGICGCEFGHPFSPVERTGLLVLLLSFAYFMAGLKVKFSDYVDTHEHWNDRQRWLWIGCYSLSCITLPSMLLQAVLKYFALLDYQYVLNKYGYFAKVRTERCRAFAKQFCMDRGLGVERPPARRPQGGFKLFDCNCLEQCCKLNDACKACHNNCEDGQAQTVNSLFASLFAGIAFAGSCLFVVFGVRLDLEASEDVWREVCIGTGMNFFFLWPLQDTIKFLVLWQYQHWEGPRYVLFGKEIPPRSELSVEMHQFFCLLDRDADGLLSREEMSSAVRSLLHQDLSEEGWANLLRELDADQDGQLSLREIEAIRSEFAAKAGWWMPPVVQ